MSDDLLGQLSSLLGQDSTLDALSSRIGEDRQSTEDAVAAALPALLGGLKANASDEKGAQNLAEALRKDHDGSALSSLSALLDGSLGGRAADGEGIVRHVLGDDTDSVTQSLSARTGVDKGAIAKLLPVLAPLVMGWLGKNMSQDTAGATSSGGLSDILGSVLGQMQGGGQPTGGGGAMRSGGGLGDILGSMLGGEDGDRGGLGSILGSLFGKR